MTERAKYQAKIKQFASGDPFIVLEPSDGNIPALEETLVALDLKPGTTPEEAREVERVFDQYVDGLALTRFKD